MLGLDNSTYYIHGGPGWLLSRASAKILLYNKEKYMEAVQDQIPDDVIIFQCLKFLNLTIDEVEDRHFLGTDLDKNSIDMITSNQFENAPKCRNVKGSMRNGTWNLERPFPFNKIIIWHGSQHGSFPLVQGQKYADSIPKNVGVYLTVSNAHFCTY